MEGYCAGEKDVLDTFNKWVRHFSLSSSVLCAGVTAVVIFVIVYSIYKYCMHSFTVKHFSANYIFLL